MKTKFLSAVLIVATMTTTLIAGGYQVNEHNARAMGMGGAFVALASDASAVFFNPAGLGFQKGFHVLVGTTLILPSTSVSLTSVEGLPASGTASMKSQVFFPSNLYGTYSMGDWNFGLGVYSFYGLGTEWEPTWAGRHYAVKTDLRTFYINPTVAYKVNDQLSVGVGVSYILGDATLTRKVSANPALPDADLKLNGNGSGVNFNVGILYKASDQLSVGVSYRHSTDITFDGDATYSNVPAPAAGILVSGKGKVKLPMPSNLSAGLAYAVSSDLTLAADFQYVGWSAYDKLAVSLPGINVTSVKDWENAFLLRLGGEYHMDKVALRAGVIYDNTPQPDKSVEPLLPDANRLEFTIGAGYEISDMMRIDLAYQYIHSSDRKAAVDAFTGPSGTYKSSANLFGINLGFTL